jgi:hypothetical protein
MWRALMWRALMWRAHHLLTVVRSCVVFALLISAPSPLSADTSELGLSLGALYQSDASPEGALSEHEGSLNQRLGRDMSALGAQLDLSLGLTPTLNLYGRVGWGGSGVRAQQLKSDAEERLGDLEAPRLSRRYQWRSQQQQLSVGALYQPFDALTPLLLIGLGVSRVERLFADELLSLGDQEALGERLGERVWWSPLLSVGVGVSGRLTSRLSLTSSLGLLWRLGDEPLEDLTRDLSLTLSLSLTYQRYIRLL